MVIPFQPTGGALVDVSDLKSITCVILSPTFLSDLATMYRKSPPAPLARSSILGSSVFRKRTSKEVAALAASGVYDGTSHVNLSKEVTYEVFIDVINKILTFRHTESLRPR